MTDSISRTYHTRPATRTGKRYYATDNTLDMTYSTPRADVKKSLAPNGEYN